MPRQPDDTYAPAIELDDSKKWVVKLVGIDEQPSKFRDRRKDAMTMIHRWLVYDSETGVAITDEATGDLYEQWQFTSDATYDNEKTGKIAPAREIANALMGRRLSGDEVKQMIADGWAQALVGKMAIADMEWYSTPDGTERLRILRLKPYRPRKAEPAQPEPPKPESPSPPRVETITTEPPKGPTDPRRIVLDAGIDDAA